MKRSQALSLALLAGAGLSAFALARLDPSQDEEDALVYRTAQECVEAGLRPEGECRDEAGAAKRSYRGSAPRYEDRATCTAHHGASGCRPLSDLDWSGGPEGAYVPYMAAYLIGRRAGQAMTPQPLYPHRPEDEEPRPGGTSGGYGGYCSGGGARVYAAKGGGVSQVPRSVTRSPTTTPRVVARGGFGFTGRGVSAHGSGGGHGSSGS